VKNIRGTCRFTPYRKLYQHIYFLQVRSPTSGKSKQDKGKDGSKRKKIWNRSGAQPIRILPSEPESTFVNLRGSSEGETPPLNLRGSGDRKIQTESPRFKLRSTQVTPSQVTKDPQPRRSISGSSPLTLRPSTSAMTTRFVADRLHIGSPRTGDIESPNDAIHRTSKQKSRGSVFRSLDTVNFRGSQSSETTGEGEREMFSHREVTVLFVPDLSECFPSLDAWRDQWLAHKRAVAEREAIFFGKREV